MMPESSVGLVGVGVHLGPDPSPVHLEIRLGTRDALELAAWLIRAAFEARFEAPE